MDQIEYLSKRTAAVTSIMHVKAARKEYPRGRAVLRIPVISRGPVTAMLTEHTVMIVLN